MTNTNHGYAELTITNPKSGERRQVIVRADTLVDANRIANDYQNDRNYAGHQVKLTRRF